MRILTRSLYLIFLFSFSISTSAQWKFIGLGGKRVLTLKTNGNMLYACTDDGIYLKNLTEPDTLWSPAGLQGNLARALTLAGADTILASIEITGIGNDNPSLFRTTNGGTSWYPFQNGFGGESGSILVHALERDATNPEVLFGTGDAVIAKSTDGGLQWRKVWGDWGGFGMGTHFVRIDANAPTTVWAGGESAILNPFLLKSTDSGESWQFLPVNTGGDDACYSIAIDPSNPDVVYVGMEGKIIKTTNGGTSWNSIFTPDTYPYFFGIAVSPSRPSQIYSAGRVHTGDDQPLLLYLSTDGGASWESLKEGTSGQMGVLDLLLINSNNIDRIYFGTDSVGVYEFSNPLTNVEDERPNDFPLSFALHQNYPNPFNPTTKIKYSVSKQSNVILNIYDVLGRDVITLVNEEKLAGNYSVEFNAAYFSSGIYFYRMRTGDFTETKKMILLR